MASDLVKLPSLITICGCWFLWYIIWDSLSMLSNILTWCHFFFFLLPLYPQGKERVRLSLLFPPSTVKLWVKSGRYWSHIDFAVDLTEAKISLWLWWGFFGFVGDWRPASKWPKSTFSIGLMNTLTQSLTTTGVFLMKILILDISTRT